jgi:hypothetical protein
MEGERDLNGCPFCYLVETMGLCLRERWLGDGRDEVALLKLVLEQDCRHLKRLLRQGRPLRGLSRQSP